MRVAHRSYLARWMRVCRGCPMDGWETSPQRLVALLMRVRGLRVRMRVARVPQRAHARRDAERRRPHQHVDRPAA